MRQKEVRAPFDGALIATVPGRRRSRGRAALATAYALFRDRDAWLPPSRRIEILRKAASLMEERAEALALEAAREGGKPLVDSRVEVARAIDGVLHLRRGPAHRRPVTSIPMNINAASARPRRVHAARADRRGRGGERVQPPAEPDRAPGRPGASPPAARCIVKPAGDTPLSCLRFVEILREAGLPAEWCQALVIDDGAGARSWSADRRVGFFSFIGSGRVGWMLRSKLAPGTRCALEHGGVAPAIVAADADLDVAVPKLVKGGFYHAGQVCVSVQRIFAHRAIADQLAAALAERRARSRSAIRPCPRPRSVR